jgi:hypothetical protein
MEVLSIAPQITTGISLTAFVGGLVLVAYRGRLKTDLEIIKSDASVEKIEAVLKKRGIDLEVPLEKLEGSQQLRLAIARVDASLRRTTVIAATVILLAIILAVSAVILYRNLPSKPEPDSAELERFLAEALPSLNVDSLVVGLEQSFQADVTT